MNRKLTNKIIVLSAISVLTGCSSIQTQPTKVAANRPILSAAQAQSMIRVTVTSLAPIENPELTDQEAEAIVATND